MGAVVRDLEGDRLGPYRLIQLIRRGGQGTVYLGYDDRLRRRVAIKLLSRPDSRKLRKQLVHEARMVARLDNPHLIKIYDVVQVPSYVALVMEYVPGCDLEQLLAVTPLSQSSILSIASDIASALASVRQQGIVHGDVKAANVLITRKGRAKLTDLGISRDGGSKREIGAGSPGTVSPEQLRGEPLDVRADLFALGCLLYRMLSGKHPYVDDAAVYQMHGTATPLQAHAPDGSLIDVDLRKLVDGLVQQLPDRRPGSTQEVRRVVRTVRRNMPLGMGNTLLEEARPWFRREIAIADIAPAAAEGLGADSHASSRSLLSPWRMRLAGGAGLVVVLAVGLVVLLSTPTRVQVNEAVVEIGERGIAPALVDDLWLQAEVLAAARAVDSAMVFIPENDEPETTLSTVSVAPAKNPDENLDISLRCSAHLCLLDLTREWGKQRRYQQAILLPGQALSQWREAIQSATAVLYTP